jgi:hypothetical protein
LLREERSAGHRNEAAERTDSMEVIFATHDKPP